MKMTRLHVQTLENREVPADLLTALKLTGLTDSANMRIAADPVGNIYVVGSFSGTVDFDPAAATATNLTSKGGTDVFVAKYGYGGKLIWARSMGGTGDDRATDVAFDGAGNVYTSGVFSGTADFNPGTAVANLTSAAGGSAFVSKLDFNGNYYLARSIAGQSTATSLATDVMGNIFVTGKFFGTADFDPSTAISNLTTSNGTGAAYVWRIEAGGNLGWARALDSTGSVEPTAIAVDGAGNVYTGGRFTGIADFDPSTSKYNLDAGTTWTPFVSKLGYSGNFVWANGAFAVSAPAGAPNGITGLTVDSSGNVYAAGNFAGDVDFDPSSKTAIISSKSSSVDGFAWKLNASGGYLWSKSFGGVADENVTDLGMDKAGNTFITGTFTGTGDFDPATSVYNLSSGTGAAASFILRLNSAGGLTYARAIGGGSSTTKTSGIWGDGAGNVYVAGSFSGVADFDTSTTNSTLDGGTGAGFIAKLLPAYGGSTTPGNSAPTNVTAGGPYSIIEGAGLTLRASATDPNGDALTYTWDLNGDGVYGDATGATVVLSSAQMVALGLSDNRATPLNIRVKVSDGVNAAVLATTTLSIASAAPTLNIAPLPRLRKGYYAPLYVSAWDPSFADRSAGLRFSYDFNNDGKWDFGNGASYGGSVAQNRPFIPSRFLTNAGLVTIKVRVFDKDGNFTEGTVSTVVVDRPPTGHFGLITRASPGVATTFAFTNVKDPSTPSPPSGLTYSFDLNNDGVFETVGSSATAVTTYTKRGIYTAHGRITKSTGEFTDFLIRFLVY